MGDLMKDTSTFDEEKKEQFLLFSLSKEEYGIEIGNVVEIMDMQSITFVPKVPDYVKGVINVRGKVVPVIDMRIKFGKEFADYNERTNIIIISVNDMDVGLIVDSVNEIKNLSDANIVPPPNFKSGFHNKFINRICIVNDRIILMIDCDMLLKAEEIDCIKNISNR